MSETKIVSRIRKTSLLQQCLTDKEKKARVQQQIKEALSMFDVLYSDIEECWADCEAIYFDKLDVIFYPKLLLLMEKGEAEQIDVSDFDKKIMSVIRSRSILGKFDAEVLSEKNARKVFFQYDSESRDKNYKQILCKNNDKYYKLF